MSRRSSSQPSSSSVELPLKTFMQSLMEQHQIAYFADDNAFGHSATTNSTAITTAASTITIQDHDDSNSSCSFDDAPSQPQRWKDDESNYHTGSPTFPKRRLSYERKQSLENFTIEQVAADLAESIASKQKNQSYARPSNIPSPQKALLGIQQRYATVACSKAPSLPTRSKGNSIGRIF